MKIGIVGLGLMGGSFAKAISRLSTHCVYGMDIDPTTQRVAGDSGAIQGILTSTNLREMDLVLLCMTPDRCVQFVREHAEDLTHTVMDICGIKRRMEKEIGKMSDQYGFRYVPLHPMAGRERGGFENSTEQLYRGAYLIATAPLQEEEVQLFSDIGFSNITYTTAPKHDRMIAFTSQLPHVMSNAFVKSPQALNHEGYSADSLKDLTRVARLDVPMWTELFFENKDFLEQELDGLIHQLTQYLHCLRTDDVKRMHQLLQEGSDIRKKMW